MFPSIGIDVQIERIESWFLQVVVIIPEDCNL